MKILVTGGAGFIGSHITDELIANGHKVIVVDNLSVGKKENVNLKAQFYNVDIRNIELLEKIFLDESPDIVNHHAAQSYVTKSMKDPSFDAEVNIIGSLTLLNLSLKYGVKKFVFASTSVVYPEPEYIPVDEKHQIAPMSNYGITKYAMECYLRLYYATHNLFYCAFRYGNVYGPRQDPNGESGVVAIFAKQILQGARSTIFGDGSKTRDYVYIDDVVKANLLGMFNFQGGDVFNVSCGIETSDFEVFNTISEALKSKIKPLYTQKRSGELDRSCLDSQKAKIQLGWVPKVDFKNGILVTVDYYKNLYKKCFKAL